jgi:hypothetical protein
VAAIGGSFAPFLLLEKTSDVAGGKPITTNQPICYSDSLIVVVHIIFTIEINLAKSRNSFNLSFYEINSDL